jgi:hypothetical protein
MQRQGMWDESDGLFYDRITTPDGGVVPVKVHSMVGIIPLLAAAVIDEQRSSCSADAGTSALTGIAGRRSARIVRRAFWWLVWCRDELGVDLGRQLMDEPRQVGVRVQFLLTGGEVVVGLGLLDGGLTVLSDHDERRQEDRRPG